MIRIDVGVQRKATATADATTVLIIGGPPGAALPVSPFEYWYAAQAPNSRGDYDAAIEIASEGLADYPEHPTLRCQLACYEALAGRPERALDHFVIAARANPDVIDGRRTTPTSTPSARTRASPRAERHLRRDRDRSPGTRLGVVLEFAQRVIEEADQRPGVWDLVAVGDDPDVHLAAVAHHRDVESHPSVTTETG